MRILFIITTLLYLLSFGNDAVAEGAVYKELPSCSDDCVQLVIKRKICKGRKNLPMNGDCHVNLFSGLDDALADRRFWVSRKDVDKWRAKIESTNHCLYENDIYGKTPEGEPYCVPQSKERLQPCPDPCRVLSNSSERGCVLIPGCRDKYNQE